MINLLPDERKRDIIAGRTNVILLRYNILTLFSVVGLAGICAMFYMILQMNYDKALADSQSNSSKANSYTDVRKQADEYRKNLTLASSILNGSVNYTPVIFNLAKLLPDGVILDSVGLSSADFGQQINFTAHAKNIAQATKLKENFQQSPMLSNVYFQSLTDQSSTSGDAGKNNDYPIAITISLKIDKDKAGQ